jgi:phosphatidylinositol alpha-mannosyltransferase
MRIVQVSPYSWDVPGGVQAHIRQLTRHLRTRGHEVLVLAPGDTPGWHNDARIVGRTMTLRLNGSESRLALAPSTLRELANSMVEFDPDVVHVHEPFCMSVGLMAVWSSPAPVVATFHSNLDRETLEGRLYSAAAPLLRPTYRLLSRRIAVSQAARRSVKGRLGKGDVKVVPNGVDVDRFANARPAPDMPVGLKLLFVGRFDPRKGLPFAARAFAMLADRYPDLHLLVVGDGPERDAIDELPSAVRPRVHMLGKVSDEELPMIYKAADIFIAPATGGESFGIVLVEAMAAGLPVVASDISGYRDVARDGKEAVLVAPSDANALAAGIAHLLEHPDEQARLARNASARARDFDWEPIVDQLETVYESVVVSEHARAHALAHVHDHAHDHALDYSERADGDRRGAAAGELSRELSSIPSSLAAMASHVRSRLTQAAPARPIVADRIGSVNSSDNTSAMALGDSGFTTNPVSPSRMASGAPPESPATTARPTAAA